MRLRAGHSSQLPSGRGAASKIKGVHAAAAPASAGGRRGRTLCPGRLQPLPAPAARSLLPGTVANSRRQLDGWPTIVVHKVERSAAPGRRKREQRSTHQDLAHLAIRVNLDDKVDMAPLVDFRGGGVRSALRGSQTAGERPKRGPRQHAGARLGPWPDGPPGCWWAACQGT